MNEYHIISYIRTLRPFSRIFALIGSLLLVQFFLGLSKKALRLIRFMDVRIMLDGFGYFFIRDGSRAGVEIFLFVLGLDILCVRWLVGISKKRG